MSRISPSIVGHDDAQLADTVVVNGSTAPTAVALNAAEHANRLYVLNAIIITSAKTITLPKSTGSGNKYAVVNNAVQTQSVVVAALGADVMSGSAFLLSETSTNTDVFHTSATSDKYTFNVTTTGGLRGDVLEAVDIAAGTWLVKVLGNGSGTMVTGFAAT